MTEVSSAFLTPEQVRRLAAYLPVTLARRVLDDGLPEPGIPRQLPAAALFSDISGFTTMSEELASDGPRGAEELNRVLLMTFTAMIDVIHQMGGAVSHFYGDAMSVYFPDSDGLATRRALACAQMMQRLMLTSFNRVVTNRPPGKDPFFELTIKIGVGYGLCQELVVGHPERNLEFVLTGTAVDEAAAAEKKAKSGQVIASRKVLARAGFDTAAALPAAADGPAEHDFAPFDQAEFVLPAATPILDWQEVEPARRQRLAPVALAFVHRALARRLLTSGTESLAEHRPVTSLFVQFDFVGDEDESSAIDTVLMGRQLQQYYEWACRVVARFGQENARVNRVLTGDKGNQLHIMFGAPVAPDGPDQAIRCALALQREKPAFIARQRIGLTVGKVFAGPVGSAARQEYTVVGDVVNLSARLMQICEDGQIFTDRATAERTRQWFEFESLPVVYLKGKQTAVTPHIPIGERTTTPQLHAFINRWERPLVGRQVELDELRVGMNRSLEGQGGVLALSGATGVGKSRLIAAAAQYWLDAGGLGLLGVGYPHTSETPYSLWRGIWQAFLGLTPGMDVHAQAAAVVAHTQALLPEVGDDVGLWGEVLGLPMPQAAALAGLTAEARQARLFALVRRCFWKQAGQRPLLLILEGLHWADQASLALLDDLTAHVANVPVFVCVTFRPDAQLALATLNRPLCTVVNVAELAPQPARQLLAELVGVTELPPAVEQHLGLRDRDGRDSPVNPLFLEEAVRMMEGIGVLQRNGRVYVNESLLAQVQVPDTIHGLLLARLDRLPVAERELLQVASVIGRQFAAEPLAALLAEPSTQLIIGMLVNLSTVEMTRLIEADPEWIYLFQHAMTHEVAYESLPYARRQMLHTLVADWLIKTNEENLKPLFPVLAYHYGRAANNEKGLEYALKAADAARDIFANQEAVDLYTQAEGHLRALGEADHWATAVEIYLSRSNSLIRLGHLDAAFKDAANSLALAERYEVNTSIAQSCNLMAQIRYRQGDYETVSELTNRVINTSYPDIPADLLASAYTWAGWAASSQMNYDLALSHLRKAEKICVDENNNFHLALVMEALSYTHYLCKDMELSLEAMQRSVALSREFSTPINLGIALNNIGFVQYMLGRYEEAVHTFDEAVVIGRDSGRNLLVPALSNRGAARCGMGWFSLALLDFQEAMSLLTTMNYPSLQVETHLFWGFEYYCALAEWEQARHQFERASALIDLQPESYGEEKVRLLLGLGQVELMKGSLAVARTRLKEADRLINEKGFAWWRPVADYFLGLLNLHSHTPEKALKHFENGLKAGDDAGCPDYKPLILWQLALLETGDKRADYFEQCVAAANKRSRYQDRVTCLKEAGTWMLAQASPRLQALGHTCLKQVNEMSHRRPE